MTGREPWRIREVLCVRLTRSDISGDDSIQGRHVDTVKADRLAASSQPAILSPQLPDRVSMYCLSRADMDARYSGDIMLKSTKIGS